MNFRGLYENQWADTTEESDKILPQKDRFGFPLENHEPVYAGKPLHILTEYDRVDEYRLLVLDRLREAKWLDMLDSNLPAYATAFPSKFRRRVRRGIPASLRGIVWLKLSGAQARLEQDNGLYRRLVSTATPWESRIQRDLHRTFPRHPLFRDSQGWGQKALGNVLCALAQYDPQVGYCQGLGFIVAMLLEYMDECSAFWLATVLLSHPKYALRGFFLPDMPALPPAFARIDRYIQRMAPDAYAHVQAIGVDTSMFLTTWLMTGLSCVGGQAMVRVWDLVLLEGVAALEACAASLFCQLSGGLMEERLDGALRVLRVDGEAEADVLIRIAVEILAEQEREEERDKDREFDKTPEANIHRDREEVEEKGKAAGGGGLTTAMGERVKSRKEREVAKVAAGGVEEPEGQDDREGEWIWDGHMWTHEHMLDAIIQHPDDITIDNIVALSSQLSTQYDENSSTPVDNANNDNDALRAELEAEEAHFRSVLKKYFEAQEANSAQSVKNGKGTSASSGKGVGTDTDVSTEDIDVGKGGTTSEIADREKDVDDTPIVDVDWFMSGAWEKENWESGFPKEEMPESASSHSLLTHTDTHIGSGVAAGMGALARGAKSSRARPHIHTTDSPALAWMCQRQPHPDALFYAATHSTTASRTTSAQHTVSAPAAMSSSHAVHALQQQRSGQGQARGAALSVSVSACSNQSTQPTSPHTNINTPTASISATHLPGSSTTSTAATGTRTHTSMATSTVRHGDMDEVEVAEEEEEEEAEEAGVLSVGEVERDRIAATYRQLVRDSMARSLQKERQWEWDVRLRDRDGNNDKQVPISTDTPDTDAVKDLVWLAVSGGAHVHKYTHHVPPARDRLELWAWGATVERGGPAEEEEEEEGLMMMPAARVVGFGSLYEDASALAGAVGAEVVIGDHEEGTEAHAERDMGAIQRSEGKSLEEEGEGEAEVERAGSGNTADSEGLGAHMATGTGVGMVVAMGDAGTVLAHAEATVSVPPASVTVVGAGMAVEGEQEVHRHARVQRQEKAVDARDLAEELDESSVGEYSHIVLNADEEEEEAEQVREENVRGYVEPEEGDEHPAQDTGVGVDAGDGVTDRTMAVSINTGETTDGKYPIPTPLASPSGISAVSESTNPENAHIQENPLRSSPVRALSDVGKSYYADVDTGIGTGITTNTGSAAAMGGFDVDLELLHDIGIHVSAGTGTGREGIDGGDDDDGDEDTWWLSHANVGSLASIPQTHQRHGITHTNSTTAGVGMGVDVNVDQHDGYSLARRMQEQEWSGWAGWDAGADDDDDDDDDDEEEDEGLHLRVNMGNVSAQDVSTGVNGLQSVLTRRGHPRQQAPTASTNLTNVATNLTNVATTLSKASDIPSQEPIVDGVIGELGKPIN